MRGGPRPNAGRKPGSKNKATIEREVFAAEGIKEAIASGVSPLEIMLTVMRGGEGAERITDRQFQAARDAAPYIHPRLANTTLDANIKRNLTDWSDAELEALAAAGGAVGAGPADGSTH